MNVIIVGAGEVGLHIAERLSKEGHEVTVIEKSRDKQQHLRAKPNALVVHGSGPNAEVLAQAGIGMADPFVAVTDQDEVNLVVCLMAHECGTRKIVACIAQQRFAAGFGPGRAVLRDAPGPIGNLYRARIALGHLPEEVESTGDRRQSDRAKPTPTRNHAISTAHAAGRF
jgi:voltage-gated potassium channel Kch